MAVADKKKKSIFTEHINI